VNHADSWRVSETKSIQLDRPRLLGVINTTPDSFSDGALALEPAAAADRAVLLVRRGADALDIGAESTRPGAAAITPSEQIARAIPAIRSIRAKGVTVPITIDTTSNEVARAALDAGADAINDVSAATEDPEMLDLAASRGCSIILMHRLAPPSEDSYSDQYDSPPGYDQFGGVVDAVIEYLSNRAEAARSLGMAVERIVLDPGLGFGKSVEQNLHLMAAVPALLDLGYPMLVGASRKSFIGAITGESEPERRVAGSVGAAVSMAASGVRLFRVHDIEEHHRALCVYEAVSGAMEQNKAPRGSSC
jgi:dihydropteroate synthase